MIIPRPSAARGHANHGWLDTYHTFSFADYHDPAQMGHSALRVINEDRVAPGAGFPTHGHRDMEIITYVLEGALEHKDSMGNSSVIRPGEVQRMSAGSGVMHSEYNASPDETVHLLQIWLLPNVRGIVPGYEQKTFPEDQRHNRLCLVAAPDGRDGALTIHQDAYLYAVTLDAAVTVQHALAPGRRAYAHVARGVLQLNGAELRAGDGARVTDEAVLSLRGTPQAEVLLFDLP